MRIGRRDRVSFGNDQADILVRSEYRSTRFNNQSVEISEDQRDVRQWLVVDL